MAIALVALACGPKKNTDPEPVAPLVIEATRGQDQDRAAELAAIADAIDPGPQEPLSAELPDWMLASIGVANPMPDEAAELRRLADTELDAFGGLERWSTSDPQTLLVAFLSLARATVYSERAAAANAADADTLARLERAYNWVDMPMLGAETGLFSTLLQMFAGAAATEGHIADAAQVHAIGNLVLSSARRAGPLHRRTVALLLRADPNHEAVPQALADAATAVRREDDALAIRMGSLSVELRGNDAEAKHWRALADLCHRALELECGGRALAKAKMLHAQEKGDDDSQAALDDAVERGQLAARVAELASDATLEGRIERCRGLLTLERHEEARAGFEALRRDHPDDARPVAGLARHALETRLDFVAANEIIDGAGTLTNGDAEYYELAIGTRATAMLPGLVPKAVAGDWDALMKQLRPVLERMKTDTAAYEKLGHSDGTFLRFVIELVEEVIPKVRADNTEGLFEVLRGALPRTMALQAKIPDNPHAYRLVLTATQFSPDHAAAAKAAATPIPEVDDDARDALQLRRVQGLADVAVIWDDVEVARQARDAALALDPSASRIMLDARMGVARLLGESEWAAADKMYEALIGDPRESSDAVGLNNWAVAKAETGDIAGALLLWERSTVVGESWSDIAKLNLLVKRRLPGDVEALEELAKSGRNVAARLGAWAWLVELSPDKAGKARAKRELAKAVAKEAKTNVRPTMRPSKSGVALEGNLQAGLGYATKTGLQINLDAPATHWLTFPPPVPIDPGKRRSR